MMEMVKKVANMTMIIITARTGEMMKSLLEMVKVRKQTGMMMI